MRLCAVSLFVACFNFRVCVVYATGFCRKICFVCVYASLSVVVRLFCLSNFRLGEFAGLFWSNVTLVNN